ncbi:hypothetical protein [Pseudomonas syringae group genomosp. 3]|uniref:hypothetical protein n=1 Tax=Pseudomonas syringae group genomosp. 3 TaxID=251701 RepID=UPI0006B927BF|nr:hypothetical protein [Pseudomonas syringae group genomosp. 3]KPC03858.1 Uncharacterized protein AC503_4295 [Pseudomonas syringae pv. maculicola]MBM0211485.1 hypothetical protein [Pseudomonas syringae pv. maculicola]
MHIIINNYDYYKHQSFFLSIENHDDFIFFHYDHENITTWATTFQAKKASKSWTLDKTMHEIIDKIITLGAVLKSDPNVLHPEYWHKLNFLTNAAISFNDGAKKERKSILVNEANIKLEYKSIDEKIQKNIKKLVKNFNSKADINFPELDFFALNYIDLPKTYKAQKEALIGLFENTFGYSVKDHKAAIETLLSMFRDIELKFNQGNIPSLTAKEKQLCGNHIKNAFNIITSKQKAYDFWRAEGKELCKLIKISVYDQRNHEFLLSNCFDYFKDLTQFEHQKILQFVSSQTLDTHKYFDELSYIEHLFKKFKASHSNQLTETEVKFAIIAAYVETREPNENDI